MEGLSLKGLKKYPALIPLYVCLGFGVSAAVFYTARLALKNPDISWNKKNLEPWNEWTDKENKLYNPTGVETPKSQAPKF